MNDDNLRQAELKAFLFITVILFPILAVAVVGGYGFWVWLLQAAVSAAVATHGDIKSPVNRGLNCVKGYFLLKIMYGKDRLTQPMLRMKGGKYDKNGEFAPITWEQAFDIMAEKWKATLNAKGLEAIGMFGFGQWTVYEGYVASKLMKAGFRSNNIESNALH